MQEEYIKIGLRRLQIVSEYNRETLRKDRKSFKPLVDKQPTHLKGSVRESFYVKEKIYGFTREFK
jgi:hypothetical protein